MAASKEQELGDILNLKLDANGLFTAIAVDADSGEVLMVGFMKKESLEETLSSGKATYWSRSRNKRWQKGEESGNYQIIQSVHVDCDQDAIVMKVKPIGPACHNGFHNCFYRQIIQKEDGSLALKTTAQVEVDPATMYKK